MAVSTSSMKFFGISQPISTALPTEADRTLSQELDSCLRSFNLIESPEELQKRGAVLTNINGLLQYWVQEQTKMKLPFLNSSEFMGRICTFGSYRLGVHNKGADIDALCVVPRHISREEFFSSFFELLRKDPLVADLYAVPEAFVPVIKMNYDGIEMDLLFARIAAKNVTPDISMTDDEILKNVDDWTMRSLNGCRVAEEILACVPNQETFISCLRAVKHWAKTKGIYSNTLGFFGGITWSILVARVCQLYPNAAPSKTLQKFFYVFEQWDWPSPVLLKEMDNCPPGLLRMKENVWDPRTKMADRFHLMPIITPSFPQQNSTYNVSQSTKEIIVQEIKEGKIICDSIMSGSAPWSALFEETNFFTRYKHFIAISAAGKTKEDHLIFSSFVESKLRLLVGSFDRNQGIKLTHVNPKKFSPLAKAPLDLEFKNPVANLWFVGLDFDLNMTKNVDLTREIAKFVEILNKQKININTKVDVRYVRQKDIKLYISKEDMLKGKRFQKKKAPTQTPLEDTTNQKVSQKRPSPATIIETRTDVGDENCPPQKKQRVEVSTM